MIRFKCIYCGQRILAPDNGAGKKGKCPKCQHDLVVPKSTKGRPAINSDKEPTLEQPKPYVPEWDKNPRLGPDDAAEAWAELYKESFNFLIPTYDELSLFLMAVTLIALYFTNGQLHSQINTLITKHVEVNGWTSLFPFALVFFGALGLCIYHVFTTREKTIFEKRVMMGFAVLTNLVTGTVAAMYTLTNASAANLLLVFPVWNIINGVLLLLMAFSRIIDEECISDRDATAKQVFLGLIAVFVVFVFCNYVFKLHWAITFSICIIYTTSFDKALQSVFPGLTSIEDEQTI